MRTLDNDARMAAFSDETIRVAEDVWTEDEPTLAEYELTAAILKAARITPPTDAASRIRERLERLEDVADRWEYAPGGRSIARRAKDKAEGLRLALRILEGDQ